MDSTIFVDMNRIYPIGEQYFEKIRSGGMVYIDKTRHIHQLVTSGSYYFLSRPRRFGKSLLLTTIKELFEGNRQLFKGLWIADHWNWEQKHPVIHLSLSRANYQDHGLTGGLNQELERAAKELNIILLSLNPKDKFSELIEKAAVYGQVVVLVDEYDKPLIDYLDDPEKMAENRVIFKNFYSILKDSSKHIRLLLITGVSRFSKVSIFSDLNNLNDITLNPAYSTLAGITQEELQHTFHEEIAIMQQQDPDILQKIKTWYNGYSWDGINKVYNPFSLLSYIGGRYFDNFWIDTGTPSFLIKHVRENPSLYLFREEEFIVGADMLKDLSPNNPNPVALMFQTGFLTIKEANWDLQIFTLVYPNQEVKQSVLTYITAAYSFGQAGKIPAMVSELRVAFIRNDIPYVMKIIDTLFISIPNPLWINAKESFYHGIIFNTFQLLGIHQESEVFNALGRVDIIVKTNTHIYVLEFKLDHTADNAIEQIFEREYLKSYQLDGRKKVAVGINFSSDKKAISEYSIKEV